MAIIKHIRGDEEPLWELVVLEVFVEEGEVLDLGGFVLVVGNGVKNNSRAEGSSAMD